MSNTLKEKTNAKDGTDEIKPQSILKTLQQTKRLLRDCTNIAKLNINAETIEENLDFVLLKKSVFEELSRGNIKTKTNPERKETEEKEKPLKEIPFKRKILEDKRRITVDSSFTLENMNSSINLGGENDSTGEINLKILIQKESEIRDLRIKTERLEEMLNEKEKKLEANATSIKELKNLLSGYKTRENGQFKDETKRQKSIEKIVKDKKVIKPSAELSCKKKKKNYNRRLSVLQRSVSEPKEKFTTPKKIVTPRKLKFKRTKDDAALSTIKFRKTRTLFSKTNQTPFRRVDALAHKKRNEKKLKLEVNRPEKNIFEVSFAGKLNETILFLSDKNEKWQNRIKKMKQIEQIVTEKKENLTKDQLHLLKNVLIIQIYDLRSAIVRQVCNLMDCISRSMPNDIFPYLGALLNALFSRVYNSTRAIRDPCAGSVRVLIQSVDDPRCVKELLNFTTDPHSEVKALSIEMIGTFLDKDNLNANEKIDRYSLSIEIALRTLIRDANRNVRRAAQTTFNSFSKKWPEKSAILFDKFDRATKKFMSAN